MSSKVNHFNSKLSEELSENSIRAAWERSTKNQTANNKQIVNLSLGNPSDLPPKLFFHYLGKLTKAGSKERFLGYMDNAGYIETRHAIARDLSNLNFFSKAINENYIVLTCGASGGINCTLHSLLNPLDEVILLSPYFVDYPKYILNHKGAVKTIKPKPPFFDIDIYQIEKTINKKTKAIIINSPNNPTGKIYSTERLKKLSNLLKNKSKSVGHPIFIISDEVYREIVYPPARFFSPVSFYSNSIMVYSFSKSLNIPGERIGYVAINPEAENANLLFNLIKLSNRTLGFTNAPAIGQKIIPRLLPLRMRINDYQKKRDILIKTLKESGFEFQEPEGAFYLFVKKPIDGNKFAELLEKIGLIVVDSDPFGIKGYFRIAFCYDMEIIKKGCKKLFDLGEEVKKIKRRSSGF